MNATDIPTTTTTKPSVDIGTTIAAAFFGYAAGAVLFGIGVRQAYQYYTTCSKDPWSRKAIIGAACFLDSLHLAFATVLVYCLILSVAGYPAAGLSLVWSLKAVGSTQVVLIVLVQGFYLSQIWRFVVSGNLLLHKTFSFAIQCFVVLAALFALVVAVIFTSQLQRIQTVQSFGLGFEYIVYLGFGATAIIDSAIAATMCILLHKSSTGTVKAASILETLIMYFIGSGLLTSFAAIMCITLYVANPDTMLYLGMTLSMPRLYANSLLAISNGREGLRNRMDETIELHIPSGMFFGEPDQESLMGAHMKSPFSPEREAKYPGILTSDPFATPTRRKYLPLTDPFSPGSETRYSPTESEGKTLTRASSRSNTV